MRFAIYPPNNKQKWKTNRAAQKYKEHFADDDDDDNCNDENDVDADEGPVASHSSVWERPSTETLRVEIRMPRNKSAGIFWFTTMKNTSFSQQNQQSQVDVVLRSLFPGKARKCYQQIGGHLWFHTSTNSGFSQQAQPPQLDVVVWATLRGGV